MGKETNLYELFDAPTFKPAFVEDEATESPVPASEIVHAKSPRANDLYALDFSTELDAEPATQELISVEITSNLATIAIAEVVQIQSPREKESTVFPGSVIKRFDEVLSFITTQDKHVKFSLLDVERLTQHLGSMSDTERRYFQEYCRGHEAVEYFGEGLFGLADVVDAMPRQGIGNAAQIKVVESIASPSIVRRAEDVANTVLSTETKTFYHLQDLVKLSEHHGTLSRSDLQEFKQACKTVGVFDYLDRSTFAVRERITPENYWPGQTLPVNGSATVAEIATAAFERVESIGVEYYHYSSLQEVINSTVTQLDSELMPEAFEEVLALLTGHSGLIALPGGGFVVKKYDTGPHDRTAYRPDRKIQDGTTYLSRKELKNIDYAFGNQRHRAFSTLNRPKKRPFQKLTRFPKIIDSLTISELLERQVSRMRKGSKLVGGRNTKLHGKLSGSKKRRQQGRAHGKKKTFDQLLAESTKSTSQPEL